MRTTHALFCTGIVLVATTWISLSQDKAPHGAQPRLTAPREASTAATAGTPNARTNYPVIGYLEKRDRTITIKAGPNGSLYSVKTADGKVLCQDLSAEQLRAQSPELLNFVKTAVASTANGTADARLRFGDARIR